MRKIKSFLPVFRTSVLYHGLIYFRHLSGQLVPETSRIIQKKAMSPQVLLSLSYSGSINHIFPLKCLNRSLRFRIYYSYSIMNLIPTL